MPQKTPNPIDVYVGSRVRLRRMIVGMSQEKLGEYLGLTFQQVQKYEKGTNRIGASRIYQISKILDVPVQFFFDGAPDEGRSFEQASEGFSEDKSGSFLMEFVGTSEGLELNRAFQKISNASIRRNLLDLVRTLADDAAGETQSFGGRSQQQPQSLADAPRDPVERQLESAP